MLNGFKNLLGYENTNSSNQNTVEEQQEANSNGPILGKSHHVSWGFRHQPVVVRPQVREYQDYNKIKKECLSKGILFEDPEFPAENDSLMFSRKPKHTFKWLRPKEIVHNPVFFGKDSPSRFNMLQGELGDCWLVAATANLTKHEELLYKVVPPDQNFETDYAGIFRFCFWKYGNWVEIVVDDRLPTIKGNLVYVQSAEKNEFWSALLEKAYAKMNGSYESLATGSISEAMVDLTGGISEAYKPKKRQKDLFNILLRSNERHSLIGCNIEGTENEIEEVTPEGLIKAHAYSVTGLHELRIQQPGQNGGEAYNTVKMIRLRNPWGDYHEWKGAWSDGAPEWNLTTKEQQQEIGLHFLADGEFWMSFDDFVERFDLVEIVNLTPDVLEQSEKIPWDCEFHDGEWASGATAGGCSVFPNTFWQNPQYKITLKYPDPASNDGKCTVCISLMQKHRRMMRKLGKDFLHIGYEIYLLNAEDQKVIPASEEFFRNNKAVALTKKFRDQRETCARFHLPPGVYVVVPSTYIPNQDAEFLIRVFSSTSIQFKKHDRPLAKTSAKLVSAAKEIDLTMKIIETYETIFYDLGEVEVGWKKIKVIMDHFASSIPNFKGFSKETVRSAIAMVDDNRNGKIDIDEFRVLITRLATWKLAFERTDRHNLGMIGPFYLRETMESLGYELNNSVLNMLKNRYGRDDGSFYFDDFVMCAIKVTALFDTFKRQMERRKFSEFQLEDWLEATIFS